MFEKTVLKLSRLFILGCRFKQGVWISSLMLSIVIVPFYESRSFRVQAQSVILPMPRLMTTMPMGATIGKTVELKISGQYLDGSRELFFSDPKIIVQPVTGEDGTVDADRFLVTVPEDCVAGMVEARVKTRLGISSPRAFTLSSLPEVTQEVPSSSQEEPLQLTVPSVCNAYMPARSVCYYRFACQKGQHLLVDCAAKSIESKLNAVLIIADDQGRDLVVERRGDRIEFVAPETGQYLIKVHELTFKGGPEFFFRLRLREATSEILAAIPESVSAVNAFSWPPDGLPASPSISEQEPNNQFKQAQQITLPCDLGGAFAEAADVDLYEFEAKKGQSWWIEVGSERMGRPTDVAVLVQRVTSDGEQLGYEDVLELNDIASPIKVSTNHYAYDGPPYNAGSPDVLGELTIPEDGSYVLRVVDLFGGTRNDPRNVYRLIVREAAPDFSLVGWAMHMGLRNGDRNAVSKPLALRNGSTMPIEVVVLRRDGFTGPIDLSLDELPDGVTASGITIAEGESRGVILLTADEGAPAGHREASFVGRALVEGKEVQRRGRLASMAWPVRDHWQEIPAPRLLQKVLVSVSGSSFAPVTISTREKKVWEVRQGEKLTLPLVHLKRSEFSGAVMTAKTLGKGFEKFSIEIPLDVDHSEAVLDLATLKPEAGDHTIAFYGGAVAKYRYYVDAVLEAEKLLADLSTNQADLQNQVLEAEKQLVTATEEEKSEITDLVNQKKKSLTEIKAMVAKAEKRVTQATDQAKPKDIVDIVVSEPIQIRVLPGDKP